MAAAFHHALKDVDSRARAKALKNLRREISKVPQSEGPPAQARVLKKMADHIRSVNAGFKPEPVDQTEEAFLKWIAGPKVLQSNDHSRLHKFIAALDQDEVRMFQEEADALAKHKPHECVPFIVQHDWAGAFAGAHGWAPDDEIQPPYDHNAFEFYVSGRCVITFITDLDRLPAVSFCQIGDRWYGTAGLPSEEHQVEKFVLSHVKAICLALDAEVATKETIRAPERLNRERAKKGRLPLKDYHVIRLNRRARSAPLPRDPFAEPSHHKRMHFVRGHWRHFESHKTWIKWHLRGNPDLGFIDKEYRL